MSSTALATVASASSTTGVACTAATRTVPNVVIDPPPRCRPPAGGPPPRSRSASRPPGSAASESLLGVPRLVGLLLRSLLLVLRSTLFLQTAPRLLRLGARFRLFGHAR